MNPQDYRPKPAEIPASPGVYRFRDENGTVLYVGKAKSLRARVSSYFRDSSGLHSRTRKMVSSANSVDWTVVSNEVEALQLEYTQIKEFDPQFNVIFRDDRSYPYLAITINEEIPRVFITRRKRRAGVKYFGPFTNAGALRGTLESLTQAFPLRTCSAGVLASHKRSGRPCLLGFIDKCSAPCTEKISLDEHRALGQELIRFMSGRSAAFIANKEQEMSQAAAELQFERAATLRDEIGALRGVLEKTAIIFGQDTDLDCLGVHADELELSIYMFRIRDGRVRGEQGWIIPRADAEQTSSEFITSLIKQHYGQREREDIPPLVITAVLPDDQVVLGEWLSSLRGAQVSIRRPQRGEKLQLIETVNRNAAAALSRHKLSRASDLTARSEALTSLQTYLHLPQAPLRIESYDISHLQGTNSVGSMVVVEDGAPARSEYRRFHIKSLPSQAAGDDAAALDEVLRRRFRNFADSAEKDSAVGTKGIEPPGPSPYARNPNLLVIDGGPVQVSAAQRALDDLGVSVPVISLAKRLEEVWFPGEDFPLILPRNSEALYLLQRLRDEAHRFAISFHRSARSKSMLSSALDNIPGVGPTRIQALLAAFGSVPLLRKATMSQICAVPGIGPELAERIMQGLQEQRQRPTVNLTTGEIDQKED